MMQTFTYLCLGMKRIVDCARVRFGDRKAGTGALEPLGEALFPCRTKSCRNQMQSQKPRK
jgi:hypothetical protein